MLTPTQKRLVHAAANAEKQGGITKARLNEIVSDPTVSKSDIAQARKILKTLKDDRELRLAMYPTNQIESSGPTLEKIRAVEELIAKMIDQRATQSLFDDYNAFARDHPELFPAFGVVSLVAYIALRTAQ